MKDWTAYLETLGGRLDENRRWRFATDASSDSNITPAMSRGLSRVPLAHLGIVEFEGPDAARFLQGQCSANTDHANGDFAPLGAFCSPKGRMYANAQLLQIDTERYWLIMDHSLCQPVASQLNKYAPFYKITLRQRDDQVMFGLIGTPPAELHGALALPERVWHMARGHDVVALRHPGSQPRWLMIADADCAHRAWEAAAVADIESSVAWQRQDIEAGIAWLTAHHSDALLPQMINWEALGGISFRKGCYTGQEVVARAHFRGQVKRRLQIATIEAGEAPLPGSDIVNDAGKRVGEIFQALANSASPSSRALVVLNTSALEETGLVVDGHRLQITPLPYPLERADPESVVENQETEEHS